MGFEAKIQQKINAYRQSNPKVKLSDEQILSILVKNGDVVLTEDQKRSLFANNSKQNDNTGLKLEKTAKKPNPEKTIYLQSGRKVVYSKLSNGKTVMKYYGTDGNRLNNDYFKKVEGQISISADGNSYTVTKNGKKQTLKAKNPTQGAVDQNIAKLNNQEKALNKAKKEQGWIGKGWDWVKNTTGIGDGSDKAQQQINAEKKLLNQIKTGKVSKKDFKEATGLDYTKENLAKFQKGELSQAEEKINGYKEGQDMATDMVGDMVSGIAAVVVYTGAIAAAPVTGGASLALGFSLATASGAAIKVGVKALDTVGTDKKYTWNDVKHDAATGGFSGALAPFTAGLGGAVGKTVATKFGVQAVKSVGKEVAADVAKGGLKSTLKTALTNPAGYEYVGGNFAKRAVSMGFEMATDGALGGAIDGGFRAGLDSDWDAETMLDGAIEGGIGGAVMAPVIGGSMKAAGKGAQKVFSKENVKIDANGKEPLYIRSNHLTKKEVLAKIENKPELKSNEICKCLMETIERTDLDKEKRKCNLELLDMVISCDCLKNNNSLIEQAKTGFLMSSKDGLHFLEKYVNTPELRNNKYISTALLDLHELYKTGMKYNKKFANNVIKKFQNGDLSVIDDIYQKYPRMKNYYSDIPESFIGKQVEDLSENEIEILKKWIFTSHRDCRSELLKEIFPAIPTRKEDFTNIVNRIHNVEKTRAKIGSINKSTEIKKNLSAITQSQNIESYNKITSLMPNIFKNGKTVSEKTIKLVDKITKTKDFQKLKDKDKNILVLSAILQDSNENLEILSKKAVSVGQELGFSKVDSEKLANITCCANLISDFMKTTKKQNIHVLNNEQKIITNERKEFFDNVAFVLKEGNTFELAKILYSSKEQDGLTRFLDKMLAEKIHDIKSHDFMLPQTPSKSYHDKAQKITINKNGKEYKVRIIKRSAIENFQGYVHTPENVSFVKDASIEQNTAKFLLANNENLSNRIICACYVDNTSKSFVNNKYNYGNGYGFVLEVPNNKQYVGAGSDISSLEKTRTQLIQSYYNKHKFTNNGMNVPTGTKMTKLRTLISDNIKEILNISDDEYIKRIDNIKNKLGDEVMSIEALEKIDNEFANAYKTFLSRRIKKDDDFNHAILRDDYEWNEFLISEAKIKDIYTTDLQTLSEDYLKMASNPNNDFVIILMYQ